jgi:Ca-activated chloride channel family protein
MRSFSDKEEIGRSIVVITDSENHEDDAVAKAKEAYEKGIIVNVIGVGSLEGGPIPDGRGGFRKDKDGNPVVTKMNEAMGQQIAEAGGGVYVRADNATNAMKVLKEEMDKVAKGETESKVYSEYNEQYQIIAWIVLLLLLLEFCILERKNGFFAKFKLFD